MIAIRKLRPYTGDVVAPSPNHDTRKARVIEGIVLHATQDAGHEHRALTWLRSPRSRVSCHLFVGRDGRVTRLVGDHERAWHAGVSWWRGTSDVNSITLGIEIANRNDGEKYTEAQYARVAAIVASYCRQGLTLDDVVSHAEISKGRKTDPVGWQWDRFRTMVRDALQPEQLPAVAVTPARDPAPAVVTVTEAPAVAARAAARPERPAPRATAVGKRAVHSRTIWLNSFAVLASLGVLAGDGLDLAHRVGITLPAELTRWALVAVGLLNILLRFRTTCPIGRCHRLERPPGEVLMRTPGRAAGREAGGAALG